MAMPSHFTALLGPVTHVASAPLIIGAATLLAYSNSFSVPLHLDDTSAITHNPSLRRLWPPFGAFSPPDDATTGGRPLSNFTFALNYAIGGARVVGYHVVNLLIHFGAALALFGVVRRSLAQKPAQAAPAPAPETVVRATVIALVTSVLWAAHPLQTATVTYLSQRTEALMGLCYLLTLYGFIRGCAPGRARLWLSLSVAACVAGMASKEPMVTAPVLVALYDRIFVARSWSELWRQRRFYYGFLAATWLLLAALLAELGQRRVGFGAGVSAINYALTECQAVLLYLRLALWPHPLVFDYGPALLPNAAAAAPFVLALGVILAATFYLLARQPRVGFLALAFFILLAPTSSVVPVAMQPIAENRVYLPLAAALALAACSLAALGLRTLVVASVLLTTAFVAQSRQRNETYQDPIALWRDTVIKRPENPRAFDNYAAALSQAGRPAEAIPYFQRALQLNPASANTHLMLAGTVAQLGRFAEAEQHYRRALELNPRSDTRLSFSTFLYQGGRPGDAIPHLQQVVAAEATNAMAHHYLGLAFAQLGRTAESGHHFRETLRLRPNEPTVHFSYALLLESSRRLDEAVPHFLEAARLDSNLMDATLGAVRTLIQLGRFQEAESHCRELARRHPQHAEAHYYSGLVSAALRRTPEAIASFERALQLSLTHAEARAALGQLQASVSSPAAEFPPQP